MSPLMYGQLIFDKGAKKMQCGKDMRFNKRCWENWITASGKMKLYAYLIPITEITQNELVP